MSYYTTCCRCGKRCPTELSSADTYGHGLGRRNESAVVRTRGADFDPLMITPALLMGGYVANTYNATHKGKPDPFYLNKISEDVGNFSQHVASTTDSIFKWNPFAPGAGARPNATSLERVKPKSISRRNPDTLTENPQTQRDNNSNPRGNPQTESNTIYSYERDQNPNYN